MVHKKYSTQVFLDTTRTADEVGAVYVSIDCEKLNSDCWWALAMLVVEYQTGVILGYIDCYASCETDTIVRHPGREDFWNRHKMALAYNHAKSEGHDRKEEECLLVDFVARLRASFPDFYLVSDNPVFDVGVLNMILSAHNVPPVGYRNKSNPFRQSICTWSFRLGKGLRGPSRTDCSRQASRRIRHLYASMKNHHLCVRTHSVELGPPHTALYDCVLLLALHFTVMEEARGTSPYQAQ